MTEVATTAQAESPVILTVNGGSSSIKFAVFSADSLGARVFSGQIERVGMPVAMLSVRDAEAAAPTTSQIVDATFDECVRQVLSSVRQRLGRSRVVAIAHRLVRGGAAYVDHQVISPDLISALRSVQSLDPPHLPSEITIIDRCIEAFPRIAQVACFDTAFHRDLPHLAQLLPIPRRYFEAGVRRLGFHGLSYTYLMEQLAIVAGPEAAAGRVILAHLGSGSSMAAVRNGKPIDTTMSFTPTAGLVMGTRPGDLDPGLLIYLMKDRDFTADELENFITRECGLVGVSETTGDMHDLLTARAGDPRAVDAVNLFCYQAKKHLCAMAAALGGLDTVIFAGGIGERSSDVRAGICDGLRFLGLHLDASSNAHHSGLISARDSRVAVRVIPTEEEQAMMRIARSLIS
ncbi:MAG: acetate kinase, partial [Phycisphaerales bacterium]|nr:acetate kinase [Phycisphaerales bacterium]